MWQWYRFMVQARIWHDHASRNVQRCGRRIYGPRQREVASSHVVYRGHVVCKAIISSHRQYNGRVWGGIRGGSPRAGKWSNDESGHAWLACMRVHRSHIVRCIIAFLNAAPARPYRPPWLSGPCRACSGGSLPAHGAAGRVQYWRCVSWWCPAAPSRRPASARRPPGGAQ